MFRVWFEREVPSQVAESLAGVAQLLGPGTDTPGDLLSAIGPAQGVIASSLVTYDGVAMDRAPQLRVIARTGIGYDKVDLEAATARGVAVCNAPDAPTTSTAEHAITLMLAVAKQLESAQTALRNGGRDFFASHDGLEVSGLTLGIVGAGRIGRSVAQCALGLGMDVICHDPYVGSGENADIEFVADLPSLLARSDVVSLHVPLTARTHHLIDAEAIGRLKRGAILINTARGGLIDHVALLNALDSGHLFGAGLDVTDPEPLPPDHPLLRHPDVVVTPHVATATRAGKARLYESAVSQCLQVLRGERPPHLVNQDVWPVEHPAERPQERE